MVDLGFEDDIRDIYSYFKSQDRRFCSRLRCRRRFENLLSQRW